MDPVSSTEGSNPDIFGVLEAVAFSLGAESVVAIDNSVASIVSADVSRTLGWNLEETRQF